MATSTEHLIDIDRYTGELIQGWERIKQSIFVILTTRLRTRLMRLWWGSKFNEMQDKPGNEEVLMSSMMAAISAINTYEPEFKVTRVVIEDMGPDGEITITVEGIDLVDEALRRLKTTI
ncbi:GPW/gp25 family protein [Bradyrhizobium elkanii]|uniref:Phage baseplate assembly protein W n=1 Tax=Bradyrhizobium elkanii TaxID=29448 RepID=A0ABV4F1B8_BRAEL|nr:GPW/gp25 family protein [Bradyrhizobium elkanii]MCP1757849.1 phage baseplate assembly protein W [Bradyrhizobium elkanii]MCS3881854.1 phage baseplate assembly protein W [Bradyrhizobium elkanii]MCS4218613.1 phage baseplate assembly protein W [Bradyrhizobium elkanii]MCW2110087.1 phage baseplate assembly protein W [Bradyrhizobium elkanii]MCW2201541.1 phage baseplate assembly protein W [Bradyrhizobium elkanii]